MPNTEGVVFDKEDQFKQVVNWLLEDEKLFAVYDCKGAGTGFVAVTNKRLMFYDKAMMRKKKALTSIPFSRISTVSSVDQGGMFRASSELVVRCGAEDYEFEFQGGEKAQRAYLLIMREILQSEPA